MMIRRGPLVWTYGWVIVLLFFGTITAAERPKSWGRLEHGRHAVGFRVVHAHDHSRGYRAESDNPRDEKQGRPVQVSIWYPAKRQAVDPMPYGDYLGLSIGRDRFDEVTDEDRRQVSLRIAQRRIEKYGADVDPMSWVTLETGAVRDAPLAKGSFPVILYAPGFSQPSFDNSLVCELLASHGYMVLAAPSAGYFSQGMTEDLIGIEAQVRDLEFMVSLAHDLPGSDTRYIGSFGWSWGAISVTLQQMRNSYVDAVISFDGSLEWNLDLVKQAMHFDPARVKVPYLYVCQGGMEDKELEFFDVLEHPDAMLLRFHDLTHGEFGSYRALLHNGFPKGFDYDTQSYEALSRYTLHFFEAHLRGVEASRAFLAKTPEENGVPPELLAREHPRGTEPTRQCVLSSRTRAK